MPDEKSSQESYQTSELGLAALLVWAEDTEPWAWRPPYSQASGYFRAGLPESAQGRGPPGGPQGMGGNVSKSGWGMVKWGGVESFQLLCVRI